jgi:hypothetical protein
MCVCVYACSILHRVAPIVGAGTVLQSWPIGCLSAVNAVSVAYAHDNVSATAPCFLSRGDDLTACRYANRRDQRDLHPASGRVRQRMHSCIHYACMRKFVVANSPCKPHAMCGPTCHGFQLNSQSATLVLRRSNHCRYGQKDKKDGNGRVIIPANSTLLFTLHCATIEQPPAL